MNYVDVSLSLESHWSKNTYTYAIDQNCRVGTIVLAPFGKSSKLGIIRKISKKPEFDTKNIEIVKPLTLPSSSIKLLEWLETYYPYSYGALSQSILPGFLKDKKLSIGPIKNRGDEVHKLPVLTTTQKEAVLKLNESGRNILHGITGSGKTRVYMELISQAIDNKKNILYIYPEISLTEQTQSELCKYFGQEKVHVYHSKQTKKDQKHSWLSALTSNEGGIFIGPRSALFLPLRNVGLIVVDEAHDQSLKQDNGIRYSGLVVAAALANIHKASLILGSATPPVTETYQLVSKGAKLVCMHDVALESVTYNTKFELVDMTKLSEKTSSPHMSKRLIQELKNTVESGKQALLFFNRRGMSRLLSCDECGWRAECENCDMPLVYHRSKHELRCHICGQKRTAITSCPMCNHQITQKSFGIQAVEQEILKLIPNATVARFDSDNNKADSFSNRYQEVASGQIDIVLGTQLVSKGLDLPNLQLVGVLDAESALHLPDFSSEERAFQQLTQVSGRVGRGHGHGMIIMQTYHPKSWLNKMVEDKDWHGFYDKELTIRKKSLYPPYSYCIKIWLERSSSENAEKATVELVNFLRKRHTQISVTGPAPAFYEKTRGKYRWQILVRSTSRIKLTNIIKELPKDANFDLDPISLL